MQRKELILNKIKRLGLTTCQRVGPYLIFGGVATNLYILTASQHVLTTQTCENARSRLTANASLLTILNAVMVADTGIYVFNVTGTIRAVVIPTAHWAYNRVADLLPQAPRLSNYQLKSFSIWEHEIIKAISTGIFIAMLPARPAFVLPLLPIAVLPLARLYLKHKLFNYHGSASLPEYKATYPEHPYLVYGLSTVEGVSSSINLGGALNALNYFLVNAFYDSWNEQDWPYQNYLLYGMTALGMVAGAASIFDTRTHQAANHIADTIQVFYLICMHLISMTLCFAPHLEDTNVFMNESIYIVLGIAAICLAMAEMNTQLINANNNDANEPQIEELTDNESEEETYITYGTISVSKPINQEDMYEANENDNADLESSIMPRGRK